MDWGKALSVVMIAVGLLTLAPALIAATAVWWRWMKEALQEFNQ